MGCSAARGWRAARERRRQMKESPTMGANLTGRMGAIFCTDGFPVSVPLGKVRTALDEAGLDPKQAKDLAVWSQFARAKSQLKDAGLILEVERKDKQGRWLWQLSDRALTEEQRLELRFKSHFWLDAEGGVGSTDPVIKERVETLMADAGAVCNGPDLMRIVHRIFQAESGLLPLRRWGGVYFVPTKSTPLLDKVMAFLRSIGANDAFVCDASAIGSDGLREKGLAMLVESSREKVAAIQAELKALEGEGKQIGAWKARNRIAELRYELQRITTFSEALGVEASAIHKAASSSEIDLALLASSGDDDVLVAMAHQGSLTGAVATLALATEKKQTSEQQATVMPMESVAEAVSEATAPATPAVPGEEPFELDETPDV
jgi:hypothetical protein